MMELQSLQEEILNLKRLVVTPYPQKWYQKQKFKDFLTHCCTLIILSSALFIVWSYEMKKYNNLIKQDKLRFDSISSAWHKEVITVTKQNFNELLVSQKQNQLVNIILNNISDPTHSHYHNVVQYEKCKEFNYNIQNDTLYIYYN